MRKSKKYSSLRMRNHKSVFFNITGKSIDKVVNSVSGESASELITKEVEKATGKKIGCSGKDYGFLNKDYSSDIDKRLYRK
jgi:GMP synthase PP-ATPase subunit